MTQRRWGSELDVLRSAPVLVTAPTEVDLERARLVPWLEQELAELPLRRAARRAQARRRALALLGALTVAAGVGLVLWTSEREPSADPVGADAALRASVDAPAATLIDGHLESGSLEVLPGSKLGAESRFRTSTAGGARLLTSDGATLAAFPGAEFELLPRSGPSAGDALIQLSRGAIGFSVPKLEVGRVFRVKTVDALVTVVGTRFFVDASGPTCVRVEEGRVRVQRNGEERLLGAGDAWGCGAPTSEHQEVVEDATGARAADKPGQRPARGEGQLDQQNRLLAKALAAERRGEVTQARRAFEELLSSHPESQFGPEARAGLARLKDR